MQNNSFKYKKNHKNKNGDEVGYFNGSYSEIDVAKNKNWTANEIYNRGIKLLDFFEDRWQISFEEWEIGKQEFLKLEFI